jgi:histidine triad (HIT) family protein
MSDCIFCKIINKEIPAEVVFENDKVLAFKDIQPSHETHILFIPKAHHESLLGVKPGEASFVQDLFDAALAFSKEQGLSHHRLLINSGEPFQEVFHVHLHLLSGSRLKSLNA